MDTVDIDRNDETSMVVATPRPPSPPSNTNQPPRFELGVSPWIWGSYIWIYKHMESFLVPEQPSDEQRQALVDSLMAFRSTLPCPGCRRHWSDYLASHPPNVTSGSAYARWLVAAHNYVNIHTPLERNVPKRQWTYDEARAYYLAKMFAPSSQKRALDVQEQVAVEQERIRELETRHADAEQSRRTIDEQHQRVVEQHERDVEQIRVVVERTTSEWRQQSCSAATMQRWTLVLLAIVTMLLVGLAFYAMSVR